MRETSGAQDKKLVVKNKLGCQTVFSSINFGTDFSPEGRLVTRSLLEAFEDGVGIKRVQPIFPILIFKVKKGINRLPGDPNKDLYEYSKLVAAKRFYPTFVNLDATFNFSEAWDVNNPNRYEDECSVMGCRTRVFDNRHGKKQSSQRGNACFGSVNLPRLGILANKNKELFFKMLEEKTLTENVFDMDYIGTLIQKVIYRKEEDSKKECVPFGNRTFVRANGDMQFCERIGGTYGRTTSAKELNEFAVALHTEYNEFIKDDCSKCWAYRFCEHCPASVTREGVLDKSLMRTKCGNFISKMSFAIEMYIRMMREDETLLENL